MTISKGGLVGIAAVRDGICIRVCHGAGETTTEEDYGDDYDDDDDDDRLRAYRSPLSLPFSTHPRPYITTLICPSRALGGGLVNTTRAPATDRYANGLYFAADKPLKRC